jgi:hypothetical protein
VGFDSFNPQANFHDPYNVADQNGVVFSPGSAPLYKTINGSRVLVGGLGVGGDLPDQNDTVTARPGRIRAARQPPRRPGIRPRGPTPLPEIQPASVRTDRRADGRIAFDPAGRSFLGTRRAESQGCETAAPVQSEGRADREQRQGPAIQQLRLNPTAPEFPCSRFFVWIKPEDSRLLVHASAVVERYTPDLT